MSRVALRRRQKGALFPRIATAPEPETTPKSNGTPMPHAFIVGEITIFSKYRAHCEACAQTHVCVGDVRGTGEVVKKVKAREWPRYGWETTP